MTRDGQAGLTLIEVLVALAIFAVIGAAGFAVLDQVLRVQRQTEGRLDRLAEIQRAMHLVTLDFTQAEGESVALADSGLSLRRPGGAGRLSVLYRLEDGALVRLSSADVPATARQVLLPRVADAAWRFYRPDTGWTDAWPPVGPLEARGNPAAVELTLALDGPGLSGELRRLALLSAEATP